MEIERIFDAVCTRSTFATKYNLICEAVPADAEIRLYNCSCCDHPHLSVFVLADLADELKGNIQYNLKEVFA